MAYKCMELRLIPVSLALIWNALPSLGDLLASENKRIA
jgi:hypothetical protein